MLLLWQTNPSTAGLSFEAPLNDAGAGIVNTTPLSSIGPATASFARNSTAYTRLSSGVWALVLANQPRSMYSAAGIYLGYWYELARANVLGGTNAIVRTMSDVGWVVGATLTVGTAVGVDGVAGSCALLTGGAVAATNTILFTTVLASAARTYSIRVRRVTGTSPVNITDNGGTNWTAMATTATEQLFQVTRTQANPVVGVQVEGLGDQVAVDFNTIEAATFANPSPIPVGVSKLSDVLGYDAANVGSTQGTVYCECTTLAPSGSFSPFVGNNSGSGGSLLHIRASDNKFAIYDGTNETAFGSAISVPTSTVQRAASAWGDSSMGGSSNGSAVTSGTFDNNMSMTTLGIGWYNASGFGSAKNVRVWQNKKSAAELVALTS